MSFRKLVKLATKNRNPKKDKFHKNWAHQFKLVKGLGSLKARYKKK